MVITEMLIKINRQVTIILQFRSVHASKGGILREIGGNNIYSSNVISALSFDREF